MGYLLLWFGWFGFNGGSQLVWGDGDATGASTVVLVTNLAAAAGALVLYSLLGSRMVNPNLGMTLTAHLPAWLVSLAVVET